MLFLWLAIPVLVLLALFFFLISPRLLHRPDATARCVDYMHRGYHTVNGLPENSMAAFRAAIERKEGIETDVQLTRDGIPVLFHDYTLTRMCGVDKKLADCTLTELKTYRLLQSDEEIPTLADLLEIAEGKSPLLIELKGESTDTSLCPKVAELLDGYGGIYCVESFNPVLLSWFRKNRKHVLRGQLVTNLKKERKPHSFRDFLLTHMLLNFLSRPDFISIESNHTRELGFILGTEVFRAKAFIWTVRSKKQQLFFHRQRYYTIFEGFEPN